MTASDYRAAVTGCVLVSRILQQYDLPALLEAIEKADAFGCFIDPALWMNNRDKMNEDREILRAALPLWQMGKRLAEMAQTKEGE
jgi:hypothetical protein